MTAGISESLRWSVSRYWHIGSGSLERLTGIQYLNFIGDIYGVPAAERKELIQKYGDMLEITSSLGDLILPTPMV